MRAFNKKSKTKHTTKTKYKLCVFVYYPFSKSSKKNSYLDLFFDKPQTQERYF